MAPDVLFLILLYTGHAYRLLFLGLIPLERDTDSIPEASTVPRLEMCEAT